MLKATYKRKDNGMRCVHVYKDGRELAHREFADKRLAKSYAMLYDKNYKRIK